MRFYYLYKSDDGKTYVGSISFANRYQLLDDLYRSRVNRPEGLWLEVPYSCVKRIFGSVGWAGRKEFPLDKYPLKGE